MQVHTVKPDVLWHRSHRLRNFMKLLLGVCRWPLLKPGKGIGCTSSLKLRSVTLASLGAFAGVLGSSSATA